MTERKYAPVVGYAIGCCILVFISGATHVVAAPFLSAAAGYGAAAAFLKMCPKQRLACAVLSLALLAAFLPGSGIERLLLQSQNAQVQSWAYPRYFFLLAGLWLGLWVCEKLETKIPSKALLPATGAALVLAVGVLEPFLAAVLTGRFAQGGSVWAVVWAPVLAGALAGCLGRLCRMAAGRRRWVAAVRLVLLAIVVASVCRGLQTDFFWAENRWAFFMSYPFVSGACLGCALGHAASGREGEGEDA